ncbi:MAG: hypothetical protein HN576_06615 [Bacteriovoracaceae bacterium]|jgi:hypothetical protein|nr:hypothetical protein [Bacteriovoracaceae bacterium]
MKLKVVMLFIIISINGLYAADNSNIQYQNLTDKTEVYTFLFLKHFELVNPNCHRQVQESRSPKTMIAMGCQLFRLEIDKSSEGSDKIQYKAHYQCGDNIFPFTAHCYLK